MLLAACEALVAIIADRLATRRDGSRNPVLAKLQSYAESPLPESELDPAAILNSAVDGIVVADVDSKHFVLANTAICEMLGYTADEFRSLTVRDIHPPEALPNVQRHFEQILETGTRTAVDHEVKRKDGSTFYATISTSLLVSGGRAYAVGFFHDITERKRAADALAYRDRALHAVMLGTSDLVSVETFTEGMPEALRLVGEALAVDRVLVIREQADGTEIESLWERDGVPVSLAGLSFSSVPVDHDAINEWRQPLRSGRAVLAQRDSVPPSIRRLFEIIQVHSMLLMPIFAAGEFRGNIGVDTCHRKREWTVSDIDVVATFANLIGALIVRNDTSHPCGEARSAFARLPKRHKTPSSSPIRRAVFATGIRRRTPVRLFSRGGCRYGTDGELAGAFPLPEGNCGRG